MITKPASRLLFLSLAITAGSALAQSEPPDPVSRAEYEKLSEEVARLRALIASKPGQPEDSNQSTQNAIQETQLRLDALERSAADLDPGSSGFHIAGFAFAGYAETDNNNSTFSTGFSPVFLWQVNDRLLFEAEIEFALEGGTDHGGTEVELGYANGSYIVNDYVTVGAGKFLTPFGQFGERLHPAWINKLPNMPFAFAHDGIAPMSSVGGFVRGGVPLGSMKGNYSLYVSNGPSLITDEHDAGNLNFNNFEDMNQGKAIGGRVGFLPVNSVEVGYSFQYANVSASGFGQDVNAFLQSVDVSHVKAYDAIQGTIDVRFEWVFSDVDDAVFFDEDEGEFFTFENTRNGGYAQIAYRPTQMDAAFIRDLEVVCRYDWLDFGSEVPHEDKDRWAIGLNYWFTNSGVVKVSYQRTDVQGAEDTEAILAQVGFGF
jgi:hypothetical protein